MKRVCSLILALTLAFSLALPAQAAESAMGTTLRLSEAKGTVTVKNAAGKDVKARSDMRLYNDYTIKTGKDSSAYIALDDSKAIQLDANSNVKIKKSGKQLEVSLTSGQLFFNVTKPLKSTETLNIRSQDTITGVRGTAGVVTEKLVAILHGTVDVTILDSGSDENRSTEQAIAQVKVAAGEMLDIIAAAEAAKAAAAEAAEAAKTGEPAAQAAAEAAAEAAKAAAAKLEAENIPAMVVEAMKTSPTFAEAVQEALPELNVDELIESLPEKQAQEAQAAAAAQAEAEKQAQAQDAQIQQLNASDGTDGVLKDTTAFSDAAAAAGVEPPAPATTSSSDSDSDSGSSGGSGGYTPPQPVARRITLVSPTQAELGDYFVSYDVITISGGNYTGLEIPANKELIVSASADPNYSPTAGNNAGTLTLNGSATDSATIRGTLTAASDGCISFGSGSVTNSGTITGYGDLSNQTNFSNKGTVNATGVFDNAGTVTNSGSFTARQFNNNNGQTMPASCAKVYNYKSFSADRFLNNGEFYSYGGSHSAGFEAVDQDNNVYFYNLTLQGVNADPGKTAQLTACSVNRHLYYDVSAYIYDPNQNKLFDGWRNAGGSPINEWENLSLGIEGNSTETSVTYTAAWVSAYATVTFHANNGTDTTQTQTVTKNVETALNANPFTYTNHIFRGWSNEQNGGIIYADGDAILAEGDAVALYARWAEITATLTVSNQITGADVEIWLTDGVQVTPTDGVYCFTSEMPFNIINVRVTWSAWTDTLRVAGALDRTSGATMTSDDVFEIPGNGLDYHRKSFNMQSTQTGATAPESHTLTLQSITSP